MSAEKELANKLFQEIKENREIVSEIHKLLVELKDLDLLYNKIESKHFEKKPNSFSVVFMRKLVSAIKEGKIVLNKELV